MTTNHLILCRPLLLLPSIFPNIRVFSNESAPQIRWPRSFSISPSNELGWFPLGLTALISLLSKTFKSLLQHHNSKVSILQHSTFFMVQLSHPYMTTRKTRILSIWTFVSKVMSLLFNTLPRFVIAFLPRSKHFLLLHNKLYKLRCLNQHPFLISEFYKPEVQRGLAGLSYKRSYKAEVKVRSYKVGCVSFWKLWEKICIQAPSGCRT